jgi:hypothetical protein
MLNRESLAHHEAAHCVALYSFGHRAKLVTLLPGPDGSAGHVEPLYDTAAAEKDFPGFCKQVLVCQFIGQVAEAMFLDKSDVQTTQYVTGVGANDSAKIKEVANDLEKEGFDPEKCKEVALDEAVKLAEKYWLAIQLLAEQLQKKETLVSYEITITLLHFNFTTRL